MLILCCAVLLQPVKTLTSATLHYHSLIMKFAQFSQLVLFGSSSTTMPFTIRQPRTQSRHMAGIDPLSNIKPITPQTIKIMKPERQQPNINTSNNELQSLPNSPINISTLINDQDLRVLSSVSKKEQSLSLLLDSSLEYKFKGMLKRLVYKYAIVATVIHHIVRDYAAVHYHVQVTGNFIPYLQPVVFLIPCGVHFLWENKFATIEPIADLFKNFLESEQKSALSSLQNEERVWLDQLQQTKNNTLDGAIVTKFASAKILSTLDVEVVHERVE